MRLHNHAGHLEGLGGTDRYLPIFVLLVGVLGVVSFTDESRLIRAGVSLALVIAVVASVRATGRPIHRQRFVLAALALLTAIVIASGILDQTGVTVAATVGVAASLGFAAYAVVRRIFEHDEAGIHEIVGALTAYLQVALAFAFLYSAASRAASEAFFAGGVGGQLGEFAYFSVVTITTLGFGDLAPATDLGRSLVMIETLLGQIILVVLVAYLVGRVGTHRTVDDST